ncbi:hypothetical protein [Streptodolium elevatio]
MRKRSVAALATGLPQCVQAAGTLLRCLPADVRAGVLERLEPGHRMSVLAYGGLPAHEVVALALRTGGNRRHADLLRQVLASDHRLREDNLQQLAAQDDFLTHAVLLAHPHLPASLVAPLIRRTAHDPVGLTHTIDTHSPGRLRVLLGADDPAVALQALVSVRLPAPLHDSAFLGAALRLWEGLGAAGLRDALDRYLGIPRSARLHPKGIRQLRPFLDAPHGRAQLARLHEVAVRDGESARRLRLSSNRYPAHDVLAGTVPIDWGALMRADLAEPFRGKARSALLAHPDCPREFVPRLLRGVSPDRVLAEALDAGTTTADEVVHTAAPAWWLLDFIDETTEAVAPEQGRPSAAGTDPQLFSSLPFVYALLDLDPAGTVGGDPDAWLRLLRAGPRFGGTVPELLAYAARPGPVPPPRPPFRRNPRHGAASLVMTLAPAEVAAQVAARLEPDERADRRLAPRTGRCGSPLTGWREPLTRETCLRLLRGNPLELTEAARPGSRWIWAAIGMRLIGADDLLRYARPAAAALEVALRCKAFAPALHDNAEDRLRAMAAGDPGRDSVDAWLAAVTLLADDFSGTVVELTATARAAAVRN